ncbi:hypothetical protein HY489_06820 [Candidatus Woesearchaeota archaeon]|nr:hypothetical protein [Candidatus Woesearchaeota archaeon]
MSLLQVSPSGNLVNAHSPCMHVAGLKQLQSVVHASPTERVPSQGVMTTSVGGANTGSGVCAQASRISNSRAYFIPAGE